MVQKRVTPIEESPADWAIVRGTEMCEAHGAPTNAEREATVERDDAMAIERDTPGGSESEGKSYELVGERARGDGGGGGEGRLGSVTASVGETERVLE